MQTKSGLAKDVVTSPANWVTFSRSRRDTFWDSFPRFPNRRSALGPGDEAHERAERRMGDFLCVGCWNSPNSDLADKSRLGNVCLAFGGNALAAIRRRRTGGGSLAMRFFRSCVLFVAATGSVIAGGSLALSGAAPAGASPAGITVNCPADNLQDAIYSAAAGSTLLVNGTCTGNFYINKDLTLSGPAILDGGGGPNQYGATLNVAAGTVVLNNLVVQDGVGIFNIGGGIWNSSQLTLNHSTVTHNTTGQAGGVFNMGQLTLNNSSVSDNTATDGTGGIFNCGGNPGFESFGLCTGSPTLTLNHSIVSNNVGAVFDGGGIDNDLQAALTLNFSTVSGNTTNENGGGIENDGTARLNFSTVSGNTTGTYGNGGGIMNNGTATLISSTVSGNTAGGNGAGIENDGTGTLNLSTLSGNTTVNSNGGGIENHGTATLNFSTVSGNTGGSGGGIWNDGTATLNVSMVSNNSSTGGEGSFSGGGGLSNGLSNTGSTTLNYSIVRANSAAWLGGGIFAGGGPMQINHSIVTGNSAYADGGGLLVWNGPTTVTKSAFSNNFDQGVFIPDSPPGVAVAPANFLGPGSNNPTFTTTHSTYS